MLPLQVQAQLTDCEKRFNHSIRPSQLSADDLEALKDLKSEEGVVTPFTRLEGKDCLCYHCERNPDRRKCIEKVHMNGSDLVAKAITAVCADQANRPERKRFQSLAKELSDQLDQGIRLKKEKNDDDIEKLRVLFSSKYESSKAMAGKSLLKYLKHRLYTIRLNKPEASYHSLWTVIDEEGRFNPEGAALNICQGFIIDGENIAAHLQAEDGLAKPFAANCLANLNDCIIPGDKRPAFKPKREVNSAVLKDLQSSGPKAASNPATDAQAAAAIDEAVQNQAQADARKQAEQAKWMSPPKPKKKTVVPAPVAEKEDEWGDPLEKMKMWGPPTEAELRDHDARYPRPKK